jgi:hypothetical protein
LSAVKLPLKQKTIVHNNSHYLKETGLVVDTVSSNILLSSLSKSFSTNTEDPQEIMKHFVTYTVDTVSLYGLWIMPLWIIARKNGWSLSRLLLDPPPGLQAGVGVPGWNPSTKVNLGK